MKQGTSAEVLRLLRQDFGFEDIKVRLGLTWGETTYAIRNAGPYYTPHYRLACKAAARARLEAAA